MNKDFIIKKNPLGNDIYLCAYLGKEKIVTVPDGVTFIRSYAFADDDSPNSTITKIILPDSVNQIDTAAFAFCQELKEIVWPNNEEFRIMGVDLFDNCNSLESISIPKSVFAITRIILPPNLKNLELHDDITAIGQSAFCFADNCNSYRNSETIKYLLKNPNYKIVDGFMINEKHKAALFYVERNKKEVTIPYGIETIGMYCFDEYGYFKCEYEENDYCKTEIIPVENIILPETVKNVNIGAFYNCKNLKSVKYKGMEKNINYSNEAFVECDGISPIETKIICKDTKAKKKRQTNLMLERIIIIHNAVKAGGYPTLEDLRLLCMRRLGLKTLGTSSVIRNMDFLRDRFDAPLKYDYSRRGYFYDGNFELPLN